MYVGTWARAYEREVRAACETARTTLAAAAPERADEVLDEVLTLVETMCNAEQDFCTQFFNLDTDTKVPYIVFERKKDLNLIDFTEA